MGEEASFLAFTDGKTVLALPSSQDHKAIFDNDHVLVYHSDSGTLEDRQIKKGISNWVYTEVLSGLKANDKVVTSAKREGLVDGVAVRVEDKAQNSDTKKQ